MYTATAAVAAAGASLRALVNGVVPGEIPDTFNGRCFQVTLIASANTVTISSRGGTVVANNPIAMVTDVPFTFLSPTGNQISIDEIFVEGTGSVRILILVL